VFKRVPQLPKLLLSLCFSLLLLGLSSETFADEIEFKNGAIITGTITEQNSETLSIKFDGKIVTYSKLDIKNITFDEKPIAPPQPLSIDGVKNPSAETAEYGVLNTERSGFRVADEENGSLNVSIWAYTRYINQLALDDKYTDGSGVEKDVAIRNDIQYSKASVQFKGWVLSKRLHYLTYLWASLNSMGGETGMAVAGNLEYYLTDSMKVGGGIQGLPTSRGMELNHPRFNRVDVRTMSGEYFRGSYASGIWLEGAAGEDFYYRTVLANGLSKLGVDAGQIDTKLATWSTGVWWAPIGEYCAPGMIWNGGGYGDFIGHENPAVRFGAHYTNSVEDALSQPGVDDPENSQIRLSDGRLIFKSPELFDGGHLDEVRYQMVAMDVGVKYRGFGVEAEYYYRHLDNFVFLDATDPDAFGSMVDTGFSIETSYMVLDKKLQAFVIGSQIYGDFGDPWDTALGVNWFPIQTKGFERQFRINADAQYTSQSPIGNLSLPYTVGGSGWTYTLVAELFF